MKQFKIKMIWGEDRENSDIKEFDTQAELDAYLEGVADMDGWLAYDTEPVLPPLPPAEHYQIDYLVACPSIHSICSCRFCGTNINIYREVIKSDLVRNQEEVKCARCGSVTQITYAKMEHKGTIGLFREESGTIREGS